MRYPAYILTTVFGWVNLIIAAGSKGLPEEKAHKIRTVNSICFITALLAISIGFFFYLYSGENGILIPAVFEGALFLFIIFLNRQKKYEAASLGVLLAHCLCALYFAAILGKIINISLILVFIFGISFLVYRKRWQRITGIAAAIVTLIALEVNYYYNIVPPLQLAEEFQYLLRWVALPCFLLFDALVLGYFVQDIRENKILLNQVSMLIFKTSHEMRNNLASNTILIDLLNTEMKDNPEFEKLKPYVEQLSTINHSMRNIVNNVLNMGEIENGGPAEIHPETFELQSFIQNIIKIQQIKAESRNLPIQLTYDNSLPRYIESDPLQMNIAITNLISNAIKYGREGTPIQLRLQSTVNNSNKFIEISVANQCPDIPQEKIKLLFNKFMTAKHNKKIEGSGLGLYIVRNIMDQCEGTYHVTSENGLTTFTISFPLIAGQIPEESAPVQTSHQLAGLNLSFAEDDLMQNKLLGSLLQSFGCAITSSIDGRQLIDKLEASTTLPDCIILDDSMQTMNGSATLQFLKADERFRHITVIMITGKSGPVEQWLNQGAQGVIRKPYDRATLLQQLSQHLHSQALA
ncbi:ATP-binding protein [Chitinophaga sp. NPDC101104]|uniref:hybrid sensor histidine kinase/response regulator n=1 Tax=Chitinophaga sp. NPDC101104 TaxID=3390561 RepID=UPI003D020DDB